ncbi:MAG: hypothetical protein C4521_05835 [Actinobacteria bacterium]|nr:MAG: hypothetical protein C4521_05835 [Actinomycetota bacterium]
MSKAEEINTILADLAERSDDELREILDELYREEERLSYRRRILHGKIDILRAELVARLKSRHASGKSLISAKDVDRLSDILASSFSGKPRRVDVSKEDVF